MRHIRWTAAASAAIVAASLAIAPSAFAGMSSSAWRQSYAGTHGSGQALQATPGDTSAYQRRIARPDRATHAEDVTPSVSTHNGGGGCAARTADARPWCGRAEVVVN